MSGLHMLLTIEAFSSASSCLLELLSWLLNMPSAASVLAGRMNSRRAKVQHVATVAPRMAMLYQQVEDTAAPCGSLKKQLFQR
jgi:hypothetical protein